MSFSTPTVLASRLRQVASKLQHSHLLIVLILFGLLGAYLTLRSFALTTVPGLSGTYYGNTGLTGTSQTKVDPNLDFAWGATAPLTGIAANNFSATWSGSLTAPISGKYTFTAATNDGVRVWLNGKQILGDWSDGANILTSHTQSLRQGKANIIRVDYYSHSANANLSIKWTGPGIAAQTIPASQFTTSVSSDGDTTSPSVSFVMPTDGQLVSGSIRPQVNSSDNVAVTKVEFYLDGMLQQTQTTSPYCFAGSTSGTCNLWDSHNASDGTHTFLVKAYDAAGNVASKTATITTQNTTTPTPSSSARVTVCGRSLCLNGAVWSLRVAAVLGDLDRPTDTVALAQQANINTLRLTDWIDSSQSVTAAPYDSAAWARVDKLVATASSSGLHVVLDLSTYRNLLKAHGINPYTYDWTSFLTWVANRTNTVSGVTYGSDPTIALVSFAGEVDPINTSDNTLGVTTSQVTSFYNQAFTTWGKLAPGSLRSTGGLLQLDWNSGIDWKTIMALPGSDVCAIHTYSDPDRTITLPAVSTYCGGLNKPWIDEEFGWEQSIGDATRAADFNDTYKRVSSASGAGAGIWNLGFQTSGSTFDVNTSTPLTLQAVKTASF